MSALGYSFRPTLASNSRVLENAMPQSMTPNIAGSLPRKMFSAIDNNGVKVVPSYLLKPVAVDLDNWKSALIDTGYYKAEQFK